MGLDKVYLTTSNGRLLVIDIMSGQTTSILKIDDKKILESLRNVYGKNSEGEIGFLNEKGSRLFRNTIPSDKQEEILSMLDSYYTNPKKGLTNYYADNPVK